MTSETWSFEEIEIDVTGCFTTHHSFETGVGSLGELIFPAFSQQGEFRTAEGRELRMRKPHWLGTCHELTEADAVVGVADRAGFLRSDLEITLGGRTYGMEPAGLLRQDWRLVDEVGTLLLEIVPAGIFRQGAHLIFHCELEAALVVFTYYLFYMCQQESAAAIAATAS